MYGMWMKNVGEFAGCYEKKCIDIEKNIWQEGVMLYCFETELEAIAALEFWREYSSYPQQYDSYEVMEMPADESGWHSYD